MDSDPINRYAEQKQRIDQKASRQTTKEAVRRSDISTCDYTRDTKVAKWNGRCCKGRHCCTKFTKEQVLAMRRALVDRTKNSTDRRLFVSNRYLPGSLSNKHGSRVGVYFCDSQLACSTEKIASGAETLPLYPIERVEVCHEFFNWAFCVSNSQTRNHLHTRVHHAKRQKVRDSPKQWNIEKWMLDMSRLYQVQPDSRFVLLPFANRTSVYEMFELDQDSPTSTVHKSHFMMIWRTSKKLSHIKLRKFLRFAKCSTCVNLRERKSKTMDKDLLDQVIFCFFFRSIYFATLVITNTLHVVNLYGLTVFFRSILLRTLIIRNTLHFMLPVDSPGGVRSLPACERRTWRLLLASRSG